MLKEKLFLQQHGKLANLPLCGLSWGGGNKLIQGGKSICRGWSQAASVTLQFIENGLVGLQELAAGQKLSLLLQQVDFRSVDLCYVCSSWSQGQQTLGMWTSVGF